MIDLLGESERAVGKRGDVASTSGSLGARVNDALARLTAIIRDRMDAVLSTRLSTSINSIQHGSITVADTGVSATATITSVDTTKARVVLRGLNSSAAIMATLASVELTNATTVTARADPVGAAGSVVAYFTVVESK